MQRLHISPCLLQMASRAALRPSALCLSPTSGKSKGGAGPQQSSNRHDDRKPRLMQEQCRYGKRAFRTPAFADVQNHFHPHHKHNHSFSFAPMHVPVKAAAGRWTPDRGRLAEDAPATSRVRPFLTPGLWRRGVASHALGRRGSVLAPIARPPVEHFRFRAILPRLLCRQGNPRSLARCVLLCTRGRIAWHEAAR